MINFNVPPYTGKEFDYMKEAVENKKFVVMDLSQKNVMSGYKIDFMLIE